MAGAQIRWRGLRRRGKFAQPESDLPQWEVQILDALRDLATASAERWVLPPVAAGGTGSDVINSVGGPLQPGWLLRVSPSALTCDLPLPDLGRDGIGRTVAVRHTGTRRSILRLQYGSQYIAACTAPGQIASVVWTGDGWSALTGGVGLARVESSAVCSQNSASGPLIAYTVPGWNQVALFFPAGSARWIWSNTALPTDWIGTDYTARVVVIPVAAQAASTTWDVYYANVGVDGAPAYPGTGTAITTTLATTVAGAGIPRVIPGLPIPSPIASMTNTDARVFLGVTRRGDLDTYNATFGGTANNVMLVSIGVEAYARV